MSEINSLVSRRSPGRCSPTCARWTRTRGVLRTCPARTRWARFSKNPPKSKKSFFFCLFPNVGPPLLPYIHNLIGGRDAHRDGQQTRRLSLHRTSFRRHRREARHDSGQQVSHPNTTNKISNIYPFPPICHTPFSPYLRI